MKNNKQNGDNQAPFFPDRLSALSAKTAKWDIYQNQRELIAEIYRESGDEDFVALAGRMDKCGEHLQFTVKNGKARLVEAKFCSARHCPVCQYRKQQQWMWRISTAVQLLVDDQKPVRFIAMTLTVKNCDVHDLKKTIKHLNTSFAKLVRSKTFPAIGFVKSIEVTRGADGSAHPHIHAMLTVPSDYFRKNNPNWMTYQDLVERWQKAAKLDYKPFGVSLQAIPGELIGSIDQVKNGMIEVVKSFTYSVKPEKMVECPEWFLEMSRQVAGMRGISIGGMMQEYLQESDSIAIEADEDGNIKTEAPRAVYSWSNKFKHYYRNHKMELLINESITRKQADDDDRRWNKAPPPTQEMRYRIRVL